MNPIAIPFFALAAIAYSGVSLAGGGSLTPPPGVPGKTMRSLDEIEPRIPLVDGSTGVTVAPAGNITITQMGSYFLAGDLAVTGGDAITIAANGVTVDLRGFTISSSAGDSEGAAILVNASQVRVLNGHVASGTSYNEGAMGDQFTGPGFDYGVNVGIDDVTGIHVRDLSIVGCDIGGIRCDFMGDIFDRDQSSVVERCSVRTAGQLGILAHLVTDSTVRECGGTGIDALSAHGCRGESVDGVGISSNSVSASYGSGTTYGIHSSGWVSNSYAFLTGEPSLGAAILGWRVDGCRAFANHSRGILGSYVTNSSAFLASGSYAIDATLVSNCRAYTSESGGGIDALCVSNSSGVTEGSQSGIRASNVDGCIGISASGDGIRFFASANDIDGSAVRNSYGRSDSEFNSGDGIATDGIVTGCYGYSQKGDGIRARVVAHSYGQSAGDDGIQADIVSYSTGNRSGGAAGEVAIEAEIALACHATGPTDIDNKYIMP